MGGGGAIGSKAKGPPGANLFVYNVPDQYSEADLLQLFSNFGNVISTNINRDLRTGQTKVMDTPKGATTQLFADRACAHTVQLRFTVLCVQCVRASGLSRLTTRNRLRWPFRVWMDS